MRLHTRTAALAGFILGLAPIINAVPNVTAVPLLIDCSPYPAYNPATSQAGPFTVIADSTGSSIDGLSVSAESFTNNGVDRYGFITLPKQNPFATAPNITLRCLSHTLQARIPSGPFGNATTWVDLAIAPQENWQASLSFGLTSVETPGIPVEPYAHYINGTRLPGVFLGAKGTTKWFFKYNWGGNAGEYYLLRLMSGVWGEGGMRKRQQLPMPDDRNWEGFLRVA